MPSLGTGRPSPRKALKSLRSMILHLTYASSRTLSRSKDQVVLYISLQLNHHVMTGGGFQAGRSSPFPTGLNGLVSELCRQERVVTQPNCITICKCNLHTNEPPSQYFDVRQAYIMVRWTEQVTIAGSTRNALQKDRLRVVFKLQSSP